MQEDREHKKLSDIIKQKIREIIPKSEFSDISCFYDIVEKIVLEQSSEHISESIKGVYKVNIKSSDIDLYHVTYPIIKSLTQEHRMAALSEIDELHKMYVELGQRERKLVEKMGERGIEWAEPLKDIRREKLKLLETLNKIKSDTRKFANKEAMKEKKTNAWSPRFARAIGKLITTSMSQKGGVLRKFQPNKIEDKE